MKGDFTRLTFDKTKHYRGVLQQQGRVQLDSDWNEQVQITEHRYSTFFNDFVGPSGAPAKDALGLKIVLRPLSGNLDAPTTPQFPSLDANPGQVTWPPLPTLTKHLVLNQGHYYGNGLLVENESDQDLSMPDGGDGAYLYYLDVWSREVTALEDPYLREPALGGPDTTIRIKTEWRILNHPVEGTPDEIRNLYKGIWPQPTSSPGDDWQLQLSTGELKVESPNLQNANNRLYRVEVHDGGGLEEATFKWSRDNGATAAIATIDTQTMMLTFTDPSLVVRNAFDRAKWVEVSTEEINRGGQAGSLARVVTSDLGRGVMTIEWLGPQASNLVSASKIVVRQWDGLFRKERGFPNPRGGTSVELEAGLSVSFSTEGRYRSGDYWLILVRAGNVTDWAEDENGDLVSRPPDGVKHYYAALGLVNISDGNIDSLDDNFSPIFNSLTDDCVNYPGDVYVGGKVGFGFQSASDLSKTRLRAPLNIQHASDGSVIEIQDAQGAALWNIRHLDQQPPALGITDQAGNDDLTIQQGGNVGIGTATPGMAVHVANRGNDLLMLQNTMGDPGNRRANINFQTGFDSEFNEDLPSFSPSPTASVAAIDNGSGSSHLVFTTREIQFSGGGGGAALKERLRISSDGNVGIGTPGQPDKALDVGGSGGIRISQTDNAKRTNELCFQDNGQIRSFDDNHRIIFDRDHNILELREYGDLVFSPGAKEGQRTQTVIFKSGGNVGIGTTDTSKARLVVDGDIYLTGTIISSNLPIYQEKNEMTIIDTTQSDDKSVSLFNAWIDLNQATNLNIIFCISHISYDFEGKDFLCGNMVTFEIQDQTGAPTPAITPVALSFEPQISQSRTVTLGAGLYHLGVKLLMGGDGEKVSIESMLLAVKKA